MIEVKKQGQRHNNGLKISSFEISAKTSKKLKKAGKNPQFFSGYA